MADQKSTFSESQLPEWAVHGTESQEELDSFFNSPADRGRAETAFAIPRGGSDVAEPGAGPEDVDAQEVREAVEDTAREDAEMVEAESARVAAAEDAEGSAKSGEAENGTCSDSADCGSDEAGFGFGKKQDTGESVSPRREDFAKFRCIYESKDGQLALYEDEHGHLTAVNTNRFV